MPAVFSGEGVNHFVPESAVPRIYIRVEHVFPRAIEAVGGTAGRRAKLRGGREIHDAKGPARLIVVITRIDLFVKGPHVLREHSRFLARRRRGRIGPGDMEILETGYAKRAIKIASQSFAKVFVFPGKQRFIIGARHRLPAIEHGALGVGRRFRTQHSPRLAPGLRRAGRIGGIRRGKFQGIAGRGEEDAERKQQAGRPEAARIALWIAARKKYRADS